MTKAKKHTPVTPESIESMYKVFSKEQDAAGSEDGIYGICTNVAQWIKDKYYPSGVIMGYDADDNPTAEVGADEGGHDFLVVDNHIIDFWYRYLVDPDAEILIPISEAHKGYGDVNKWEVVGDGKNPLKEICSTTKERFSPVKEVSRTSIIVAPDRFQGRQSDYSSDTVNSIVAKGHYDKSGSPIKVWYDAIKDKLVVLAGHSRLAAWDKLKKQGKAKGPIPVIEFYGDEDDAMDYAQIESNRTSTKEGLISELSAYRRAVTRGMSRKKLLGMFKPESTLNKLQKLSNLNPKGRFIEMLAGVSAQSFPYLERNAKWVGDIRKQLPRLTDAHELELFNFIYDSGKGLKLDKNQFYNTINNRVNRIDFVESEPLNLENRVSSNAYTDPINDAIAEIEKEISKSKKEIDKKRETIVRAKMQFGQIKTGEGYRLTSPILKRIDDLNRYILRKIEEQQDLRQKAGKVERTLVTDLFSEPAPEPTNPYEPGIVSGSVVRALFEKIDSREGTDMVEFANEEISLDDEYRLAPVSVQELLDKDIDLKAYVNDESDKLKPGRPIEHPILLGNAVYGTEKNVVRDGYMRMVQAVVNGDKTIMAYTKIEPTNKDLTLQDTELLLIAEAEAEALLLEFEFAA